MLSTICRMFLASLFFITALFASNGSNETSIGVLAFRPKPETIASWQPLADTLNKSIPNHNFVIKALTYKEMNDAVAKGGLDFVFTNPEHYVALEVKHSVTRIATVARAHPSGIYMKSFGGTIITLADRKDIDSLNKIKGKKIAAVGKESLGGYLAQAGLLYDIGIDLTQKDDIIFTDMPHDKVVIAIKEKKADVGFIRSSVLESMAKAGKININEFKVINRQNYPEYPFAVSTPLYPEWPFAAAAHTKQELIKKVTIALFSIPEGSDVAKSAGYNSWTTPMAYESTQLLMQKLKAYPFNTPHQLTLTDVFKKYTGEISTILAFISFILGWLFVRSHKLRMKLSKEKKNLKKEVAVRIEAEQKLKLAASVFEHASEGIVITLPDQTIVEVNNAFVTLTGFSREEVIGATPRILKSGMHKPEYYAEMFTTIVNTGAWQGEIWNRNKNGELYAELINISAVKNEAGEIQNFIGIFSDITTMKEHQEKLAYLVNYDPLTGLANRRYLHDRLEHAIQLAKRNDDLIAVIFIDLDNFKYVNDTLGHEVGDKLLIHITERIKGVIRESDTLARMGGDEFVLIAEKIGTEDAVASLAQKIVESISNSFYISHNKIFTGASLGISIFPSDGADIDTLMKKADMAMYQSKEQGKNRFSFFSVDLERKLKNKLGTENELRRAISSNEFVLYYQPQVDSRNDHIIGLEALIRWNHPQRGIVSPYEFIPTAEDSGLIVPIGDWVIMKSVSTLRIWQDSGINLQWLAINIADKQFKETTFVSKIQSAIDFFKVDPTKIKIELTEGIIMDKPDEAIAKLNQLRDLGVKISIDDFGTGYSSLSYLRRFPIDQFKIDRSFVKDIGDSRSDKEITSAMIAMGHALNIEIIAEGVETKEQLDFLMGRGCYFIQGYYYSKPKPEHEITAIMSSGQKLGADQSNAK